jgi:hypothetical protein
MTGNNRHLSVLTVKVNAPIKCSIKRHRLAMLQSKDTD